MAALGWVVRPATASSFTAFGKAVTKVQRSYLPWKQLLTYRQPLLGSQTCSYKTLRAYSAIKSPYVPACNSYDHVHERTSLLVPCDFNERNTRGFMEDRKTTALTILSDLKHLKSSPMPALVLGLSGLLPFVAAPAYMITSNAFLTNIAFYQLAYGATILSFLGGVRWGITLVEESGVRPNWFNLGYSVTPSLIAWMGLIVPNLVVSNLIVMAGLTGAAYLDTVMWGYPPWFKALRFMLSFGAVLSLWTTLMCKLILSDGESVKAVAEDEVDN